MRSAKGFALLITITLLAFLVLLLVSLASLTKVETQVASNNQQLLQARQNALLALNIALSQVQKYAGPDQRATVRADFASPSNIHAQLNTTPGNGKKQWVSFWGNQQIVDYNQKASALSAKIVSATGSLDKPILLNWLVSGNESATSNIGSSGEIIAATVGANLPLNDVSGGILSTATALSDNLLIGTQSARLLVGPNSVDASTAADNFVVAPLVKIDVDAATIPGLTGSTPTTIGRYAYWVGDEGVKARANLVDSYLRQDTPANQDAAKGYSSYLAQHNALNLMDRDNSGNLVGNDYNYNNYNYTASPAPTQATFTTFLSAIVTASQLPLYSNTAFNPNATVNTSANLATLLRYRFHDIGTWSQSVLADSYAGGLKQDLSSILNGNSGPASSEALFPPESTSDFGIPKWGILRSYTQSRTLAAPSASDSRRYSAAPRPASDQISGINPVITYATMGFNSYYDTGGNQVVIQAFPFFILWNPYNFYLDAANYELGFGFEGDCGSIDIYVNGTLKRSLPLSSLAGADYFRFDFSNWGGANGTRLGTSTNHGLSLGSPSYSAGIALTQGGVGTLVTRYAKIMTGITLSAVEQTQSFELRTSGSGGGTLNVVLAKQGTGISGTTPDLTKWYQIVRKARFATSPGSFVLKPTGVNTTAATTPAIVYRVQALFAGAGSNDHTTIGLNPSTNYPLRYIAQSAMRAPIAASGVNYGAICAAYNSNTDFVNVKLDFNPSVNQNTAGAGATHDVLGSSGTSLPFTSSALWDVPNATLPLLSIGNLQNAGVSLVDAYPSYPIGNSLADPRIDRTSLLNSAGPYEGGNHYDLSWLLNRSLMDRYFVSTLPSTWTAADIDKNRALPNGRLTYRIPQGSTSSTYLGDLNDYQKAAARLLLTGGFNVNSTSVQAWRAVLGGNSQVPYKALLDNFGTTTTNTATPPISNGPAYRFLHATTGTASGYSPLSSPWLGTRQLCYDGTSVYNPAPTYPAVIAKLATDLVAEIRRRGPFLSMSDFVNRRLINDETGLKGTLQAALDNGTSQTNSVNRDSVLGTADPDGSVPAGLHLDHMRGSSTGGAASYKSTGAFAPKFVTQADLLSYLGPALTTRSDTFTIRTYGDIVDPINSTPADPIIIGRAWCEAVVQRQIDHIESTVNPWDTPTMGSDSQKFGRRFKIVSFRWLSPNDI